MATVATWNLENLFQPKTGASADVTIAYDAKLRALSGTIIDLGIEVLAAQEIGEAAALADLVERLPGTWHTALADPDGRGIRVGVISKFPFTAAEQIVDFPDHLQPIQIDDTGATLNQMGRPALHTTIDTPHTPIDLISVHLKSKLLSFPGGRFAPTDEHERSRFAVYALHRRAAEAAAVRSHVTDTLAGAGRTRALVVAGDLNDGPAAATTQILHGPPGSEIGTAGYKRPDTGDGQRLWNLSPLIPESQSFSRIYQGNGELIDHILVSHALVKSAKTVTTGAIQIPSTTENPADHTSTSGSDHRPVVTRIDL